MKRARAIELCPARRRLPLFTALVLTAVTAAVAWLGFREDASRAQEEHDRAANQTLRAVSSLTTRLDFAVDSVRGLFVSSQEVTKSEFDTFVSGLVSGGGVSALGWVEPLPHARRATFERGHGGPIRGFDGKPVARASTYQVATHGYPAPFRTATYLLDVGHDPSQAATMHRARLTGAAAASPPLHVGPARDSFVLYVPAYAGGRIPSTPDARARAVTGFATGTFRFADLQALVHAAIPAGASMSITANGETVVRVGDVGDDAEVRHLRFAGQVWDIRVVPAEPSGVGLGLVALLLGVVITVLLTLLIRASVRSEIAARELAGLRERERDLAHAARELSEATSRTARERFRRAFEDAPIGMALTDRAMRILDVNQAFTDLLGRHHDELLDTSVIAYAHPDDAGVLGENATTLLRGQTMRAHWEARFVHADGHVVWVDIHATALGDGTDGNDLFLAQVVDTTDQRRFEQQLRYLADHDPLTGLENRRAFGRAVDAHHAHVKRYGPGGALIVLDVDHFKAVNDTLGHHAGDELIMDIADILRGQVRESDRIARLGGDEFAVLLPQADAQQAAAVAAKLVDAVREHRRRPGGRVGATTISAGVALFDGSGDSGGQLLVDADLAMYDAKEAGRDGFSLFADSERIASQTKSRLAWLDRVRGALAEDQFTLLAQPILDLASGQVVHHELLLRMVGEDGDLIAPASFLEIAERFGVVSELDIWVVREAIRKLAEHGDAGLVFEVNLSGSSIGSDRLLETIESDLAGSGVDPRSLVFEVTETAAVSNIPRARAFADRLADLGCRFALDDFGAGFGSFYYLKHLPFDFLKIDGEFVRHCVTNHVDRVIVSSLVRVATGLRKRTIAEYVGDESTIALLRDLGVDLAQGYSIGRPAPLEEWLARRGDVPAVV
ncbi:MAG: EAL domain-containing protein [Solirubrobacterales bacterium]